MAAACRVNASFPPSSTTTLIGVTLVRSQFTVDGDFEFAANGYTMADTVLTIARLVILLIVGGNGCMWVVEGIFEILAVVCLLRGVWGSKIYNGVGFLHLYT
jgi:hypothetical protein